MLKRIVGLSLFVVMSCIILTGCGKSDEGTAAFKIKEGTVNLQKKTPAGGGAQQGSGSD